MAAKGPKRWQNDDGNIKEAEQVQKKKRADIKIWKCKRKKTKSLSQKLLGRVKRQSFNCDTKSSKFKVKDDSKSMPMRRLKKNGSQRGNKSKENPTNLIKLHHIPTASSLSQICVRSLPRGRRGIAKGSQESFSSDQIGHWEPKMTSKSLFIHLRISGILQ